MTLIIAHRGLARQRPENTMAAFKAALSCGADGLETDVQETADHELVLCHDSRVDRTTNGTGEISRLRLTTIQQLDAGWRFYGHKSDIRIPTLVELLDYLEEQAFHGVLNLEIKAPKNDGVLVAQHLADVLASFPTLLPVIVVSSFSHQLLAVFHHALPVVETALLTRWPTPAVRLAHCGESVTSVHLKWWWLFMDKRWIFNNRAIVRVWTVNRPSLIKKCFQLGVTAVITDEVKLAQMLRSVYATNEFPKSESKENKK